MQTKIESPCKTCDKHPCKESKNCSKRIDYVDTFTNQDQMKAVDQDTTYRILLP